MDERYRRQWEALGASDPYWAVLTDPRKRDGRWDKAEFFRTGDAEIARVMKTLARLGVTPRVGVALDYGCGVGRLSAALAQRFERVLGVDIAEAMLVQARAAHVERPNIAFERNSGDSLVGVADASIDFVYSNIVLQHAPRKHQRALIGEFCRVLGTGGVLVFQVPAHANRRSLAGWLHALAGNRLLNLARRLRYGRHGVMEMHTMAKDDVLRLLGSGGMRVVEVEASNASGRTFVGYRYIAVKA